MRILIADDHAVVRRGLREILATAFGDAQVAEAGDGHEVLKQLSVAHYNVLILDINMPGRSGLDVLRDIKHAYPQLPVMILSVQPEDQYAMRCLRAGASAYINKDSAPEELVHAVKRVLSGRRYISQELADKLLTQGDELAGRAPHELLSDREHEVMRLVAAGVSLTDIAERLHVSAKTVSSYRARILEKMQMTTNAELTRYALERKLID